MGFIIILLLTTLSLAGSAAFFSIYGLAQIFAGSFWPVVVMASSLEAGKLVSASYVYRYWKQISFTMKTYLMSAILVLMLITSAGIFGFLSAAYQTDTLSLKEIESQVMLLEEEKAELRERKKQIDDNIASINPNYITKRMELIETLSPETDKINNRIPVVTAELFKLKSQKITEESHWGPSIYIAKVFDQDTDDATKWMILLIIFAFDPLAVALTIATNNAMMRRTGEDNRPTKVAEKVVEDVTPEEPEFGFSEKDLIEPINDLELNIEPEIDEPIDDRETEEPNHNVMEIVTPGKVEIVQSTNIISKLQSLYPQYSITGDAQDTLQMFIKKRGEEGLTLHERKQVDRIIQMLQQVEHNKV